MVKRILEAKPSLTYIPVFHEPSSRRSINSSNLPAHSLQEPNIEKYHLKRDIERRHGSVLSNYKESVYDRSTYNDN